MTPPRALPAPVLPPARRDTGPRTQPAAPPPARRPIAMPAAWGAGVRVGVPVAPLAEGCSGRGFRVVPAARRAGTRVTGAVATAPPAGGGSGRWPVAAVSPAAGRRYAAGARVAVSGRYAAVLARRHPATSPQPGPAGRTGSGERGLPPPAGAGATPPQTAATAKETHP